MLEQEILGLIAEQRAEPSGPSGHPGRRSGWAAARYRVRRPARRRDPSAHSVRTCYLWPATENSPSRSVGDIEAAVKEIREMTVPAAGAEAGERAVELVLAQRLCNQRPNRRNRPLIAQT